jgi:hypothetical protein
MARIHGGLTDPYDGYIIKNDTVTTTQ